MRIIQRGKLLFSGDGADTRLAQRRHKTSTVGQLLGPADSLDTMDSTELYGQWTGCSAKILKASDLCGQVSQFHGYLSTMRTFKCLSGIVT